MARSLSFSITGEYLTETARNKLYKDNDLVGAIQFLQKCVSSDSMDDSEEFLSFLRVLDGTAAFTGNTTDSTIRLELYEDGEQDGDVPGLEAWNEGLTQKLTEKDEKYRDLEEKYSFIMDSLDLPWYKLAELNDEWMAEGHEEPLFDGVPDGGAISAVGLGMLEMENTNPFARNFGSSMLDEFIKQELSEDPDDGYGWLSPDGRFHPVPYGEHDAWAEKWLKEHDPDWKKKADYKYCIPRDYMQKHLHWVLIDNVAHGLPRHNTYPGQKLTKKQTDWLYGSYTKRGMDKEASDLMNDWEETKDL